MYNIEIKPSFQSDIDKLCKKNPILRGALERKMNEIAENPWYYNPLKYDFAGEREFTL